MSDNGKRVGKKMNAFECRLKDELKALRISYEHQMNEGAHELGISRKQLEDIETHRNYGCHIDARLLGKYMNAYGTVEVLECLENAHCG